MWSSESEFLIELISCETDGSPENLAASYSESSSEEEVQTIPFWRSTWNKRLSALLFVWSWEQGLCGIEWESSDRNDQDLPCSRRKRVRLWQTCRTLVEEKLVLTSTWIFRYSGVRESVSFWMLKRQLGHNVDA